MRYIDKRRYKSSVFNTACQTISSVIILSLLNTTHVHSTQVSLIKLFRKALSTAHYIFTQLKFST